MARLARVVIPKLPHLVTQRGNRGETVFFDDEDYQAYIDMLSESAKEAKTQILAWCLLPTHVHMIAVPKNEDGLRAAIADAHRRYAMRVNIEHNWSGHLWQGRFSSVVMDPDMMVRALHYITFAPKREGLTNTPRQWKWSSVHAHVKGQDDALTTVGPVLDKVGDFKAFLKTKMDEEDYLPLQKAESVGRPVGSEAFLKRLEKKTGRVLRPQKRGPKPGGK